MQRGQVALEFVFIVLMMIVLATSFAWTAYYLYADYSEEQNLKRFQDLGFSLQNEVILASTLEPGYARNITVPEEINGVDVNISGSGDDIIVNYKGNDMMFIIPNVTGTFRTGYNLLRKDENGSLEIT